MYEGNKNTLSEHVMGSVDSWVGVGSPQLWDVTQQLNTSGVKHKVQGQNWSVKDFRKWRGGHNF